MRDFFTHWEPKKMIMICVVWQTLGFFAEKSTHILNKKATQYNGINGPKALIESRRGCIVQSHLPNLRGDGVEIFSTKDWRRPSAEVFHHLLTNLACRWGGGWKSTCLSWLLSLQQYRNQACKCINRAQFLSFLSDAIAFLVTFTSYIKISRIQSLAFDFRRKKLYPLTDM